MLLASLDDVKSFLEMSDTTYDDLLTIILTGVSARIETFLNRDLYKEERTRYFNAGRRIFYLPAYPIDLTATLSVWFDDDLQDLDDDYFVWETEGLIEFYVAPLYSEPKEIKITWTGGYSLTADLPTDLRYATMLQTALVFRKRKNIGTSSMTLPDGSQSMVVTEALLPEVREILKTFRRKPS